jgi:flagellar motility protein MotE (MotC chaperone)
LHLLPVLILVAALTLTVKLGHIWQAALPFLESGPSTALAQETEPEADQAGFTPWRIEPASLEAADPEPATVARDPYEMTDEEIELLQQLGVRREEIERRQRELEQREALLAAAEEQVNRKIAELEALRAAIEGLVVRYDEQEETQLSSLVKIYESMKPKEAARIFEQLDMVVLLEVIGRMKERKTAPILAKMTPDRAKTITLELAQRRELPMDR